MENKKILLVDDKPEIRTMFTHYLSKYDCREADDGQNALKILESGFIPDYIITDNRMNGISGIDLAIEIRRQCSSQIFVYSGDVFAREAVSAIPNAQFVEKSHEGLKIIVAAISGNVQ